VLRALEEALAKGESDVRLAYARGSAPGDVGAERIGGLAGARTSFRHWLRASHFGNNSSISALEKTNSGDGKSAAG
jgi:hypothetical protein